MPSSLLGYAVVENEDMADIGANAFPIAFGDFRAAYTIVDLVGLRVTLDEVTTPGQVKWIFRKRVGGKLADNQAVKVIKCATT
jgi:HK97 family phage major capsid protein